MDFASLISLLTLTALIWFWLSSIRVLEIARKAGRKACANTDVQFLDDSVACIRMQIARNQAGRRALRRTYRFEFSETGNSRIEGQVIMLGDTVESVLMDPYLIMTD